MSGIGHNGNAVVQASYSDFKLVRTRSCCQIVLELPIEEAEAFVSAFGIPIPGQERPVAVALIQPPAPDTVPRETRGETDSGAPKVDTHHPKNTAASERFRALGKPEQMVAKVGMICSEPNFWQWLEGHLGFVPGRIDDAAICADFVRRRLGIKSRSELAGNETAQRMWQQMLTDYDIWRGALPEPR